MQGIEPFLQLLRIHQITPYLKSNSILVDLGCDVEMTLIKKLAPRMHQVIGLDLVVKNSRQKNIQIIKTDITQKLPLATQSADFVTMLAVLEHLHNPLSVLREADRILKINGTLLVTVPAPQVKWLLEKVIAPLGLVRSEMVRQHKNYFRPSELIELATKAGFGDISVTKFELGFNTLLYARKLKK